LVDGVDVHLFLVGGDAVVQRRVHVREWYSGPCARCLSYPSGTGAIIVLPMSANLGGHRMAFRADIEGVRGIAVLLVVLFHAGIPYFTGGFVGVDVFFVLSGYLITRLLVDEAAATGRIDLVAFYARRARRLLPAAALMIIVTLLFGWLVL